MVSEKPWPCSSSTGLGQSRVPGLHILPSCPGHSHSMGLLSWDRPALGRATWNQPVLSQPSQSLSLSQDRGSSCSLPSSSQLTPTEAAASPPPLGSPRPSSLLWPSGRQALDTVAQARGTYRSTWSEWHAAPTLASSVLHWASTARPGETRHVAVGRVCQRGPTCPPPLCPAASLETPSLGPPGVGGWPRAQAGSSPVTVQQDPDKMLPPRHDSTLKSGLEHVISGQWPKKTPELSSAASLPTLLSHGWDNLTSVFSRGGDTGGLFWLSRKARPSTFTSTDIRVIKPLA